MWSKDSAKSPITTEQEVAQPSGHPPKQHLAVHFRDWYWELIAAVFSLACVVAIVVILRTYQEKSLSSWHFYFDTTPNTIIALLSTLSRTALIVPVASCISQLKWIHLASSPRRLREFQVLDEASRGPWGSLNLIWSLHFKTKLATWGAFITIVSLAMGPLSQQLLSFPSRPQYEASGAAFSRCQTYDIDAETSRYLQQMSRFSFDKTVDVRMQGAVLNGIYNLNTPVQVECQTGNCEWDPYTTLAVASRCKNVSSLTKATCQNETRSRVCKYTTPSKFRFETARTFNDSGIPMLFNSTARDPSLWDDRLESFTGLVDFAVIKTAEPYTDEAPDVTECGLRWAARQIQNTTVVNGTFNHGIATDYDLLSTNRSYAMDYLAFNVSGESAAAFPGNATFSISTMNHLRLKAYLRTVFTSSLNDNFGSALNNAMNLTETVQRLSDSISYAVSQSAMATKLPGRNITSEQYILVNWAWIVLPIAEVAMGIAFFAATVLQSWRKGIVVWKSSAIIPLLTEIEENWQTELNTGTARELEHKVKGMKGLLESKENGGRLLRYIK